MAARDGVWLSRLVERLPGGPVVASCLGIGWVPVLLTVGVFLASPRSVTLGVAVAQGLMTAVVVVGPTFVWRYDRRVVPTFFARASELVVPEDERTLSSLEAWTRRFFVRWHWVTVTLWTVVVAAIYVANPQFLRSLGIAGPGDPVFWVYGALWLWAAILTGIGFHGVLTTVVCLRRFARTATLRVDPLHPDGLGGLSSVGYYAIQTTALASAGALLLPLGFEVARRGELGVLVYLSVAVYLGFIVAVFAYPTGLIHRRAQQIRDETLSRLRDEIQETEQRLRTTECADDEIALQLERQRLRGRYDDFRSVRLYPMSVDILSRLVGSILLPLFLLLVEVSLVRVT